MGKNSFGDHSLPDGVFNPLVSLRYLDMYDNIGEMTSYPDVQISDLINLKQLVINGFDGKIFETGFGKLQQLEYLLLQPCRYQKLTNETFANLRNSPISYLLLKCNLVSVDTDAFLPLQSLTTLDISGNNLKISSLLPSFHVFYGRNMSTLLLHRNYQSNEGVDTITKNNLMTLGSICVSTIDLHRNRILDIQIGDPSTMPYIHCLQNLNLAENAISPRIFFTPPMLFLSFSMKNLRTLDISKQRLYYKTHIKIDKLLTTNYTSNNIALHITIPENLEYLNVSNQNYVSTKFNWDVFITQGHKLKHLDVANNKFTSCAGTARGLSNLIMLNFSGSSCSDLPLDFFNFFPSLQKLVFQRADLRSVTAIERYSKLLYNMLNLSYVDFTGNGIKLINTNLFTKQKRSLETLILKNNKLTSVPLNAKDFPKLSTLDLRSNNIEYFPENIMNEIDEALQLTEKRKHFRIHLFENPIQCNCETLKFIAWLNERKIYLDNHGNYTCKFTDGSFTSTSWIYRNLRANQIDCMAKTWLLISALLTFSLLVLILIIAWSYKYRTALKYWYYNIRRKYRLLHDTDIIRRKYDAFIAYHQSDYKIVKTKIVPFLEGEKGLNLCIHQRDFLSGLYIADNIMDAMKNSKKILVLITKNYLDSKWGKFELDMARMQLFQEDRNLLIIVMIENIPPSDMPKPLLDIWERITCIKSDDSFCNDIIPTEGLYAWKQLYESIISL
ncbi:toll-like receptor 4 [Mytilus trossulus]|uniref:toll-like receptor 4 n=1 Tax=Mytilus trossulus TaxID=6551 RepID=UPI0030056D2C